MKRIYLKIAGIINLFTMFIHLIAGQVDLVNPLISSELNNQVIGEWVSVWHIVSILLFLSAYYILKAGFKGYDPTDIKLLQFIGLLYILIGLPFIMSSFWFSVFAPQWILLMPIGLFTLIELNGNKQPVAPLQTI